MYIYTADSFLSKCSISSSIPLANFQSNKRVSVDEYNIMAGDSITHPSRQTQRDQEDGHHT